MNELPIKIEITKIGFNEDENLQRAISFLNLHQTTFHFNILKDPKFTNYIPENRNYFYIEELYKLIDKVLVEIKGIHQFTVGFVKKRLDGKEWTNLFGSMETRNNRLTGKAITTTFQVYDILNEIPIEIYYIFELLSFSIRFLVGRGLIHDEERGCLFHRKVIKSDIVDVIKSGFISLKRQKMINQFLDLEQIIEFKTLLAIVGAIARSNSPTIKFQEFSKKHSSPTALKSSKINRVFISYSHKDRKWLERVKIHLKPFQRKGNLDYWDDTKIEPGKVWIKEIETTLSNAAIAILLVSADFLASDFIAENELPIILESVEKEGVVVLIVILKPCAFSESELEKFQSLNPPSKPLIAMTEYEQEETLARLAKYTKKVLEEY